MAITRATNLAGLGTVFDALTDGGGLEITSGVSTFSDLNTTRLTGTAVTFTNATITGDLTVQGTTTTLDTTVENVDLLEVGANSVGAAVTITQSGSGDFVNVGTAGSAFIIKNTGNIGVNTDSPERPLHVNKTIRLKGPSAGDGNTGIEISAGDDGVTGFHRFRSAGGQGKTLAIESDYNNPTGRINLVTNNNVRVAISSYGNVILSNGSPSISGQNYVGVGTTGLLLQVFGESYIRDKVGIGSASPVEVLDVAGNIRVGFATTANYIAFHGTTSDGAAAPGVPQPGGAGYSLYTHTFIGERIYYADERSELLLFKGNDSDDSDGYDRIRHVASRHVFDVTKSGEVTRGDFETVASANRTTAMVITNDGSNHVGINTDNPIGELEVFSDAFVDISVHSSRTSGNIGGLTFKNGNSPTGIITAQYYATIEGHHRWVSRESTQMYLEAWGYLGLGGSPAEKLELFDTDDVAMRIHKSSVSEMRVGIQGTAGTSTVQFVTNSEGFDFRGDSNTFPNGGSSRLYINSNGNVGINSNSPKTALDVYGQMRVGSALTSNFISFHGTTGDQPSNYNHTHIGERIYGGSFEQSEFVVLKGNDGPGGAPGPDRIRLCGYGVLLDNWSDNTVKGSFEEMASISSNTMLEAANGLVKANYPLICTAERGGVGVTTVSVPSGQNYFFAIGDSDTGMGQNGDGVLTLVRNSTQFMEATSTDTRFKNNFVASEKGFSVAVASGSISDIPTGATGDGVIHRSAGQMYMTVDDLLRIRDSGSTSENKRFEFNTDTGNAGADANWNSNNFDFAEMFEWSDGNPDAEDRIGYSVCVDTLTGKIRKAEDGDTPFGIVSGTASFVANAGEIKWQGYWKRDEWGRQVPEPFIDENGDPVLDDEGNQRYKMAVNPDWNEDLSQTYTPRSQRPEWACIGVMGQVYMRKGCPVDSRWVKLKEIDEVKDLWLVR